MPGLEYHTVGIAGLAMLVHPNNPSTDISTEKVREIFNGKVRRWSDISDAGTPGGIIPVSRLHCKARPGHWRLIASGEEMISPTSRIVGDIPYMIRQVNQFPEALGYETLVMVKDEKRDVKVLTINGLHPSNIDALARGYYPFYRVFNLTTWKGDHLKKELSQQLLEYLTQVIEENAQEFNIAPTSTLREHGWKFKQNELIGEPGAETTG